MDESLLDDIIRRLINARNGRTTKQVQLTEAEIRQLCVSSKEIFVSQPNLLELEAPIKICGKGFKLSLIFDSAAISARFLSFSRDWFLNWWPLFDVFALL